MNKEDFKKISDAADSLGIINRAISTLQNSEELYFVTDYSIIQMRLDPRDVISIPRCLIDEFKNKLIAYYAKRYNVIVEDLKKVTL